MQGINVETSLNSSSNTAAYSYPSVNITVVKLIVSSEISVEEVVDYYHVSVIHERVEGSNEIDLMNLNY